MNTVQQVSTLNNEGAKLLSSGKVYDAFRTFQKAMQVAMSNTSTKNPSSCAFAIQSSRRSNDNKRFCRFSIKPQKSIIAADTCTSSDGVLEDWDYHADKVKCKRTRYDFSPLPVPILFHDQFYVYNNAIVIASPDDVVYFSDPEQFMLFCKAVVMFNMALICHWKGKTIGDEKALQRAICLYDRCVKSLRFGVMQMVMSPNSDYIRVLLLAALNNMAHIHIFELKDFKASQLELNRAMHILKQTEGFNPLICSELLDTNEIMLNALVFCSLSCAPSA